MSENTRKGATIKRRITQDMSVFSKREQLNKDYSFLWHYWQASKATEFKAAYLTLSIVPFHRRLKSQTSMQVTRRERKRPIEEVEEIKKMAAIGREFSFLYGYGTSTRQCALKLAGGHVWSAINNQSH